MYGYNAGPPMAIPIYTVLPYCVINTNDISLQSTIHINIITESKKEQRQNSLNYNRDDIKSTGSRIIVSKKRRESLQTDLLNALGDAVPSL